MLNPCYKTNRVVFVLVVSVATASICNDASCDCESSLTLTLSLPARTMWRDHFWLFGDIQL